MAIKIIGTNTCTSCMALKHYLNASLTQDNLSKLEFITADQEWLDKLKAMGSMRFPTIIFEDGSHYTFTDLINTASFIKSKLKE